MRFAIVYDPSQEDPVWAAADLVVELEALQGSGTVQKNRYGPTGQAVRGLDEVMDKIQDVITRRAGIAGTHLLVSCNTKEQAQKLVALFNGPPWHLSLASDSVNILLPAGHGRQENGVDAIRAAVRSMYFLDSIVSG